jgi:2-aminoethylphosphonate-pyruvate transaminase
MKRIMVDMSASLLHHGHVRLLEKAKALGGHVIVALTTDDEIERCKGYKPELSFEQRKEILLALKYVDEVVPCTWLIGDDFMRKHKADVLVHSGNNPNYVSTVESYERTSGISTSELREKALMAVVEQRNSEKCLLTPGPSNLHPENLLDLVPVFTRGDIEFVQLEQHVLSKILPLTGQDSIVCMQGSATTAIEVATTNFLLGNVLVILSGYYSQRILHMLERKQTSIKLAKVASISYEEFLKRSQSISGFDWVVAVYTETADAYLTDIHELRRFADIQGAKLMIDATGSINLEDGHELADVSIFSSCKGLGGLTGAGFIAYNKSLLSNINPSQKDFILDLSTYLDKKTTGPAHALASLNRIANRFAELRGRVTESKAAFAEMFEANLLRRSNQPVLCTKISGTLKMPGWLVPYQPRAIEPGFQVVCHLFDQFPSNRKPGDLYKLLKLE